MAFHRVVLSHHQSLYLSRFKDLFPFVPVFDDITEQDYSRMFHLGIEDYVISSETGNRALNRNEGYRHISERNNLSDGDIVEFFDGDRVPVRYDETRILNIMHSTGSSVVLYMCEIDSREALVQNNDYSVVDTGTVMNPFYSCGFAIQVSAIEAVRSFNGGDLFCTDFNDWGCEDQYTGLVCSKLGIPVALDTGTRLSGAVGDDTDYHEAYRNSMQAYLDKARNSGITLRI